MLLCLFHETSIFLISCRKVGNVILDHIIQDMKLGEYRALFDGINALNSTAFTALASNVPEFKDCYQTFMECQARIVCLRLHLF